MLTNHLKIPFQLLLVISNIMGGLVILNVLKCTRICIVRSNVEGHSIVSAPVPDLQAVDHGKFI